jgi:hypothetical protein
MAHIVLLGDSIFDNAAYVNASSAVIDHLRRQLKTPHKATLLAVDGATTRDVPRQVRMVPDDATHFVVSMGGNDALGHSEILDMPVKSGAEVFRLLAGIIANFERDYREALTACLRKNLPLTVCTIYNGNFSDRDYQLRATVAVAVFNDAIARIARERMLGLIELRHVCTSPEDYANSIEPSGKGAEKIATAIVRNVIG